jgi:hypothetical protein
VIPFTTKREHNTRFHLLQNATVKNIIDCKTRTRYVISPSSAKLESRTSLSRGYPSDTHTNRQTDTLTHRAHSVFCFSASSHGMMWGTCESLETERECLCFHEVEWCDEPRNTGDTERMKYSEYFKRGSGATCKARYWIHARTDSVQRTCRIEYTQINWPPCMDGVIASMYAVLYPAVG